MIGAEIPAKGSEGGALEIRVGASNSAEVSWMSQEVRIKG